MFLTDVVFAPISICIAVGLAYYIASKHVSTNWGTALDGRAYVNALKSVLHLRTIRHHAKTFRPSYLVMLAENMVDKVAEESLGNYLYSLRKGRGCVFWGQISIGDPRTNMLKLRDRFADTYKPLTEANPNKAAKADSFAPLEVLQSKTYYDGCIFIDASHWDRQFTTKYCCDAVFRKLAGNDEKWTKTRSRRLCKFHRSFAKDEVWHDDLPWSRSYKLERTYWPKNHRCLVAFGRWWFDSVGPIPHDAG